MTASVWIGGAPFYRPAGPGPLREPRRRASAADPEIVAIDRALSAVRTFDNDLGRIVECHLFGGMSLDEIAGVLGLPPRAVQKRWVQARTRLIDAVEGKPVK